MSAAKIELPWATLAALLLAAVFVAVTLQTIHFPLGTLGDEWPKIEALLNGRYRFSHPLGMIEIAQAANVFMRAQDLQSVVEVGRLCAALAGGVLVFATYLLARLVLPDLPALAATAAAAATPLLSAHARIFKEDIFVAPVIVLALVALIRLLQAPAPARAVPLGVLVGLAAGMKYVGALLLPFVVGAILLLPSPGASRRGVRALTVTGIAVLVFAVVEIPALLEFPRLVRGISFETNHVIQGHDAALPLSYTLGIFHLRESLWPGLGPALTLLGLLGLAAPFLAPPERRLPLFVVASFALLWYAVHEITPLKPYPDFGRYMLPLAPLLSILAASALYELLARRDRRGAVAAVIMIVAALPALWMSIRINGGGQDPREMVPAILAASNARIAVDRYAAYIDRPTPILGSLPEPPAATTTDLVATANLTYDRFTHQVGTGDDPAPAARFYDGLARLPHLDVSNARPTYAYFNPILRIVAMDGRAERLVEIAAAIAKAAPAFELRLTEGSRRNGTLEER